MNIDFEGQLCMRITGHVMRPYVCIPEGLTESNFLRLIEINSRVVSLCEPDEFDLQPFDWDVFKRACLEWDIKEHERISKRNQMFADELKANL